MGEYMRRRFLLLLLGLCTWPAEAQTDSAAKFGAREGVENISLSPNGRFVSIIQPANGSNSALVVADVDSAKSKVVLSGDSAPWRLSWCGWASNDRLVCSLYSIMSDTGSLVPFTRLIAVNADGTNLKLLGQRGTDRTIGFRQFDGDIVGWDATDNGSILMSRYYLPEREIGTRLASSAEGLGVDQIDTLTLRASRAEQPKLGASSYIADTKGAVRILQTDDSADNGVLRGVTHYYYRVPADRTWKPFSVVSDTKEGLRPVAVDSDRNIAYAYGKKDGRQAVFKVTLDGKLTSEVVLENNKVDIDRLVTLGRNGRVIGAEFIADKRETVVFDEDYRKLATQLGRALPGLPLIQFVDASRDENRLLLFAGSDTDPGRYYIYDKKTRHLNEIALARPQLEGVALSAVKPISYAAADGTMIPGYLTLPPGTSGKGLPTIVLPHGGPSARDEWGFDWLSQYFAANGYAVLQPNFRGSAGYGEDWYVKNGFKSWQTAVGDVNDAGRWLVKQGIADPKRLAILGWSYGGYAALQSGVLDPDLYKAVVAVAPVTDLRMLVDQSRGFTNSGIVAKFVGTGEHITSGSPLRNADRIKAPVLMFSGDKDLNVNIAQARAMESALRKLGKPVSLVTFSGLDHQLEDSAVRAQLLRAASEFLQKGIAK
jgi:dipeptidyl aminopeptidase/acylaminoacyl peptidase